MIHKSEIFLEKEIPVLQLNKHAAFFLSMLLSHFQFKERNFISTRAFVPILIFVSYVYIYICIEKFK